MYMIHQTQVHTVEGKCNALGIFSLCLVHTHTFRLMPLASTLSKGIVYFNHNEAIDNYSRGLK